MSLRSFFKSFGKQRAASSNSWLQAGPPPGGDDASAILSDPYGNHPIVNRCIDLIATSIGQVPLRLMTGSDSAPTPLMSGRWYDLFTQPNPAMAGPDFLEATAVLMALQGDCLWVLEGAGEDFIGATEIPTEIWPIGGNMASEVLSPDGRQLLGWRIAGIPQMYPAHAVVLHKWQYNPSKPWRGSTPLSSVRSSIRMDSKANRFNEDAFDNGGSASLAVTFPENASLDAEQRKQYRTELESRHVGWGRSKRILVLGEGARVENLASTHSDMEYAQQKKLTKEEIATAFGVPTFFLGDINTTTYASSKEAKRALYENRVFPLMNKMERAAEAQLFKNRASAADRGRAMATGGKTAWMQFDISAIAALLQDTTDRLTQATAAQAMGFPLNEVNERYSLGFKAQPDGDVGYLKVGLIPISMAAEGQGIAGVTGMGLATEPVTPTPPEAPPVAPEDAQKSTAPEATRDVPVVSSDRAQRREMILRGVQSKAMRPLQRRMESVLRGTWQKMRQDVLAQLSKLPVDRASESPITALDVLLTSLRDKFNTQLQAKMAPLFRDGIRIGADTLGSQIGQLKKFDIESPSVLDFLAKKELRLTGVNETVLESLRTTLVEGIGQTENLEALQDRVREVMDSTPQRALMVARTESAQTVNGSRQIAMQAEGVDKTEWITSKGPNMRHSHEAIDGQVVPLGQKFSNGCEYPGDINAEAKEVINCACISGPVID